MTLAKECGNAKKSGDAERLKKAEVALKEWEEVAKNADEIILDI